MRKQVIEKSVIAPWLGRLGELIEANRDLPRKQRYTVKRMWQALRDEGFAGGYTTVKDAVREIRKEAPQEVFMPLTQPPGEPQVDFGHALARIGGRLQKITFFVMSLIHGDAMFMMAFPRECTEAFLEAQREDGTREYSGCCCSCGTIQWGGRPSRFTMLCDGRPRRPTRSDSC